MKTIEVPRLVVDTAELKKKSAFETDAKVLISQPCIISHAGKPIIVYDRYRGDLESLRWAIRTAKYQSSTRTNGLKTTSRIFGYRPRNAIRNNFCSSTSFAQEQRKNHRIICEAGKEIAGQYREACPAEYDLHAGMVKKEVRPDWIIPGTPFTSGILNHNNPLKYHFDSGNFEDVKSCMVVLRRNISGGLLVMPEFDLKFDLPDGALIFFDGQAILHGVTSIKRLLPDAYRYSAVYYSLRDMCKCLPPAEEVQWARQQRKELEIKRAEK